MVTDKEMDEMKRVVKTDGDALRMALTEIAKNTKEDYLTVSDLLDKDNEIRKTYELKEISGYPIQETEFSPATGQSIWKRILGVKIIRRSSMLPYGELITEEVENYDPARRNSEIEPLMKKKIDEDYPGQSFSKTEIKPIERAVRNSIVRKMQLAADYTG